MKNVQGSSQFDPEYRKAIDAVLGLFETRLGFCHDALGQDGLDKIKEAVQSFSPPSTVSVDPAGAQSGHQRAISDVLALFRSDLGFCHDALGQEAINDLEKAVMSIEAPKNPSRERANGGRRTNRGSNVGF